MGEMNGRGRADIEAKGDTGRAPSSSALAMAFTLLDGEAEG